MLFEIPSDTPFDIEQAAFIARCSTKTIRRHIKLSVTNPKAKYALRARRNSPKGKIAILATDLKDYLERTYIDAEVTIKQAA